MATKKQAEKAKLKVVGADANTSADDPKVDITAEELLRLSEGFQKQETKIGAAQGKLRNEIGAEWKAREVHPKAMSHLRVGVKIADERKRLHYFRTIVAVANDMLEKLEGESTAEMDFDGDKAAQS